MDIQEERLAALEQRVADIELERLYEKRKAAQSTPSEQAYDLRQLNHRLTMLLGIASGQEAAIKSMDDNFSALKEYAQQIDQRLDSVDRRMEGGFEAIDKRFDAQDKRFDHLESRLSNIEGRFDRLEALIIDRLPPSP